jgi:YD repeat-containing protein
MAGSRPHLEKTFKQIKLNHNVMKNMLISILIILLHFNAFSYKKKEVNITLKYKHSNNCKLIEERESGITVVKYTYDTLNRLIEKKYLTLNYSEKYSYNNAGFLIEISNTSENPYITKYTYQTGLLVSKIQQYRRASSPNSTTYEYNNQNELIKTTESYLSTQTITQYANGKAITISHPHINYELNGRGLIVKSSSLSGPKTINIYKYNKNDILILLETFGEPGKRIMYTEYEISTVKKSNLGDGFIETFSGFPTYKNPFGDKNYFQSRVANFSVNNKNGLFQKVYENKTSRTLDGNGNVSMAISEESNLSPQTEYIYEGC